jgi:hypothetical protein
MADPDSQVEAVFEQVDKAIIQGELDRHVWILGEIFGDRGGHASDAESDRSADAQDSARSLAGADQPRPFQRGLRTQR